jgi:transposase
VILEWAKVRVFVKPGPTDMRKQINGLSIIVAEELAMDPLDGNLFLFCNKQRRILKVIYWDRNGFCLWQLCEASHNSHYAK